MFKSQYSKIKKYQKKRIGFITTRNIVLLIIIIATLVSVGYSYWNTTLHITGTAVIAGNIGGGGSGTETDPYVVPDVPFDPGDATNQDDGYYSYPDDEGAPVVEVENGEVVSYTITDTEDGPVDVVGVDTGVKPFDGSSSFTIHIDFYATFSSEVSYDRVVSVIQDNGTGNTHSYSGFNLFYYYSSRGSNPARYLRTQSFSNKTSLSGQNMSSGNNLRKVDTTITSYYTARTRYTFDITYTNSNAQVSVTSSINGGTPSTQTFTSDVTNLSQATVCIGCNGIDSSENVETLEVLAFSVEKN